MDKDEYEAIMAAIDSWAEKQPELTNADLVELSTALSFKLTAISEHAKTKRA